MEPFHVRRPPPITISQLDRDTSIVRSSRTSHDGKEEASENVHDRVSRRGATVEQFFAHRSQAESVSACRYSCICGSSTGH